MYKDLKVQVDGHVGIVCLSRPASHNMWTSRMLTELLDVYNSFENDPNIRVIILTGDLGAKLFCAGADLTVGDFSTDGMTRASEKEDRDGGGVFSLTVAKSRKITIAAINGSAAGVGITQTLAMDMRFAWADAKIAFPFTRRGILPEAVSTYFLPRLIGRSRALAVFLQATANPASSPLLSGLFAQLLPNREDVFPYALRIAHELAENTSPTSVAYTKSLVLNPAATPEEHHVLDSRGMYVLGNGHDGKEGVRSYLEKRKASFANLDVDKLPTWLPGHPKGGKEVVGKTAEGKLGWTKAKL